MTTIKLQIEHDIPIKRIQYVLCAALEGGSNYWYRIEKFVEPSRFEDRFDKDELFRHIDYPTNPGGAIIITDTDEAEKDYKLDLEAIKDGLKIMERNHRKHFQGCFLEENEDAASADIFLQCCIFGEVIYG